MKNTNTLNIPESTKQRVVIIGAGFGGLICAKNLANNGFQVVLIDKNNHHQFQPLYYQVAMAGLEPSSIAFPLRKFFQKQNNVHIRVAKLQQIDPGVKMIYTSEGTCIYDQLVIAVGAKTNYYNNEAFKNNTLGMKSLGEALYLRNSILNDYEKALITPDFESRQKYIDIVIVGGGATGVELAGSLAEMKQHILPKDYAELDHNEVDIYLVQSSSKLLDGMSENASKKAQKFLESLGVKILLNSRVKDIKDQYVYLENGQTIEAGKVIWAAGITGNKVKGLDDSCYVKGGRLLVDQYLRCNTYTDIFAIGDIASMQSESLPYGHPQVATVAIQQGKYLAKYLSGKTQRPFVYKDKGSMATIGRNKAVVDLPSFKFSGFFAWLIWLLVHLAALIGARNKAIVMFNWLWNYITYDQSLRLIIKSEKLED